MGKAINEKTLELNVSAEVLCFLRRTHDPTAYLRGFTQAEEKGCGADLVARFRKGPQCRGSIVMQFKAPLDRSRHPYSYKFELQRSQHEALSKLAQGSREAVWYIFPMYSAWANFDAALPSLLQGTYVARVADMATHVLFGGQKTQTVTCDPTRRRCTWNPEVRLHLLTEVAERWEPLPLARFVAWLSEVDTMCHGLGVTRRRLLRGTWAAIAAARVTETRGGPVPFDIL